MNNEWIKQKQISRIKFIPKEISIILENYLHILREGSKEEEFFLVTKIMDRENITNIV